MEDFDKIAEHIVKYHSNPRTFEIRWMSIRIRSTRSFSRRRSEQVDSMEELLDGIRRRNDWILLSHLVSILNDELLVKMFEEMRFNERERFNDGFKKPNVYGFNEKMMGKVNLKPLDRSYSVRKEIAVQTVEEPIWIAGTAAAEVTEPSQVAKTPPDKSLFSIFKKKNTTEPQKSKKTDPNQLYKRPPKPTIVLSMQSPMPYK